MPEGAHAIGCGLRLASRRQRRHRFHALRILRPRRYFRPRGHRPQNTPSHQPRSDVTGIARTMYDSRSCLVVEVSEQLKQHFGNLLFDTVIPRNIRLAEAPSHGLPALAYDAHAKGTQAYLDLADELIARLEK